MQGHAHKNENLKVVEKTHSRLLPWRLWFSDVCTDGTDNHYQFMLLCRRQFSPTISPCHTHKADTIHTKQFERWWLLFSHHIWLCTGNWPPAWLPPLISWPTCLLIIMLLILDVLNHNQEICCASLRLLFLSGDSKTLMKPNNYTLPLNNAAFLKLQCTISLSTP